MRLTCAVFGLVLLAGVGPAQASDPLYNVISLGPGRAFCVNDSGAVVGGVVTGTSFGGFYVWKEGALSFLPSDWGGMKAGINNAGVVAGTAANAAVLYDHGATVNLSPGSAFAISDSGWVAGAFNASPILFHDRQAVNLGVPAGMTYVQATFDVNDTGETVAIVFHDEPGSYFSRGYMHDTSGWHTLSFGSGVFYPTAINNRGDVAGYSESGAAFLRDGVYTLIAPHASVTAMNDSGAVVGSVTDQNTFQPRGFLWRDGVLRWLDELAPGGSGNPLPEGINNQGWIVGSMTDYTSTYNTAFVMEPGPIVVTRPRPAERISPGEPDTIRWVSQGVDSVDVSVSYSEHDGVRNFEQIAGGVPASDAQLVWTPPDSIGRHCLVSVSNARQGVFEEGLSDSFTIKPLQLSKIGPDGELVLFDPRIDTWNFSNTEPNLWPASWWNQFDYAGVDPIAGRNYLQGPGLSFFAGTPRSSFPDWPLFVDTYGQNQCYWDDPTKGLYNVQALMFWRAIRQPDWKGSCYGLSANSLLDFQDPAAFFELFPSFPLHQVAREVGMSDPVRLAMNGMQIRQSATNFATASNILKGLWTPTGVVRELARRFNGDACDPSTISIYDQNGNSAHALVPFLVAKLPLPGHERIFVYDPNFPSPGEFTWFIDVDTLAHGGSGAWDYPGLADWGGTDGLFLEPPVSSLVMPPTLHARARPVAPRIQASGPVTVLTSFDGTVTVSGDAGTIGHTTTLNFGSLPGAVPLNLVNGSGQAPYGYALPDGNYSVQLTDGPSDTAYVGIERGPEVYSILRTGQGAGDVWRLERGLTFRAAGSGTRALSIDAAYEEPSVPREKSFHLAGCSASPGDSLRVKLDGGPGLDVRNDGSAQNCQLTLTQGQAGHSFQIVYPPITLPAHGSVDFDPAWSSLPGRALDVYIDADGDGNYEGFTTLEGSTVGFGSGAGPSRFAFSAPSPNPSRGSTIFAWTLSEPGEVSLRVFDVAGREVARVVSDRYEAGPHHSTWAPRSTVAAGVYFARLESRPVQGGAVRIATQRIVLLP
jgi:hypothetical protein